MKTGTDGEPSYTTSSRTEVKQNVVTESIAPSLLDAGYMNALLTSSHHSDTLKNVVTGSTIIFFDDDELTPTTTSTFNVPTSVSVDKMNNFENVSISSIADSAGSETIDATSKPIEHEDSHNEVR